MSDVVSFEVFQEAQMVLKNVLTAVICATLLAWSGLAVAEEYRPGEFLGLDLSRAVLSPKLLGPSTEFAPVPVEARTDRGVEATPARAARMTHPRVHVAQLPKEKRHAVAHTGFARRHGNPLDAQALDTRIQAWPCKSGGICNWKR
jgi:hypothetical protein